MTDRLDPTSLPIFGTPTPVQAPPNGHQPAPTISLIPAPVRPAARSLAGAIGSAPPTEAPRPAAAPPAPSRTVGIAPDGFDWPQVAMLRAQASDQLTAALGDERGADPETERELGRAIIP